MLTGCITASSLRLRGTILKLGPLNSCLPESNKGMDQDFLIISGEWMMDFIAQHERGNQVRYLGLGSLF